MTNFLCGVNQTGKHALDVNIDRDFRAVSCHDVHLARANVCAACGEVLSEPRHRSRSRLHASDRTPRRWAQPTWMPMVRPRTFGWVAGIGTTRLMQAVVEQNRDDRGIIWPASVALMSISSSSIPATTITCARQPMFAVTWSKLDTMSYG